MVSRRFLCSFSAFLTFTCVIGIYYTYFKHPPPDELMRMNNRRTVYFRSNSQSNISKAPGPLLGETGDGAELESESQNSMHVWNEFVRVNSFVPVGEVWDRGCDDSTRKKIGVVVMLPDEDTGGVKTRTFVNYTLERVLEEAELYIEVKYNNNNLFDNHWDLCTVEDEVDPKERTIFCPVEKGFKSEVKDRIIPNYLPKGQYYTKSWITNSEGSTIMCGYSDFVV